MGSTKDAENGMRGQNDRLVIDLCKNDKKYGNPEKSNYPENIMVDI